MAICTRRDVVSGLVLLLLGFSVLSKSQQTSLLLFGMLSMDRNASSSCAYLGAKVDYLPTRPGGLAVSAADDDAVNIAGTILCSENTASSPASTSPSTYLMTVPVTGTAPEASSHVLVRLYGVQQVKGRTLAIKKYVVMSNVDEKLNVDVEMPADGVRANMSSGVFATVLDRVECRSIMSQAFGSMSEVVQWLNVENMDGSTMVSGKDACCGQRPAIACAGIGVGFVITIWMVICGAMGGVGGKNDVSRVSKRVVTDRPETPEKKVGVRQTEAREWKREGDRLRRDIKRQSADEKAKTSGYVETKK